MFRSLDDELSDDLLDEENELEKPQIILPLRDKKATVGGNVKFSCRVQSVPANCPVEWLFNEKTLKSSSRVSMSKEDKGELFVLNISGVKHSDGGEYTIVLKVQNETLTSSASLDVEG